MGFCGSGVRLHTVCDRLPGRVPRAGLPGAGLPGRQAPSCGHLVSVLSGPYEGVDGVDGVEGVEVFIHRRGAVLPQQPQASVVVPAVRRVAREAHADEGLAELPWPHRLGPLLLRPLRVGLV